MLAKVVRSIIAHSKRPHTFTVLEGSLIVESMREAKMRLRQLTALVATTGGTANQSVGSVLIPAGCILFGVTARITVACTTTGSPTGWKVDDGAGTPVDLSGSVTTFTAGTTLDLQKAANVPKLYAITSGLTPRLTLVAGTSPTWTAGEIRVTFHLLDLVAEAS